ncbi:MAG: phasin family protein [Burkholderiaceae bacterium]
MLPNQDQIAAAGRTAMENQFAAFSSLTNTAVESWGKLFDLNVNTAKASLEESTVICRQLLDARNPQEAFSFMAALLHPTAEKMFSYSRHVANIATATQTEIARVAESQINEANFRVSSLVQEAAKVAPPGAENVMAVMQTAMESASAGYQHIHRSAKQAAELAGANLNAATEQFAQASEKASAAQKSAAGK